MGRDDVFDWANDRIDLGFLGTPGEGEGVFTGLKPKPPHKKAYSNYIYKLDAVSGISIIGTKKGHN